VDDSEEVQPRADGQPLETPAPPQIDLSDEVFAEERSGEVATDEALAEGPEPEGESTPEIPAAEPELDESVDADAVDPTHQGPGDSEGHAPYAPDEAEPKSE
jgi:hypothetical protein